MSLHMPSRTLTRLLFPMVALSLMFFLSPQISHANKLGDTFLKYNNKQVQVETFQHLLHERGWLEKEEISGQYDENTKEAVKDYQRKHGLYINGKADTYTMASLHLLKYGDKGMLVAELQSDLKELGYYKLDVFGVYGPHTEKAVKRLQVSSNIQVDGIAGPKTFAHLQRALQKMSTNQLNYEDENNDSKSQTYTMKATAYTANCDGCSGVTATGINLHNNPNQKVVAVDPDVIPLGSTVEVEGYGTALAADTGGSIKGHHIDVFIPNSQEATQFGQQTVQVTVIE